MKEEPFRFVAIPALRVVLEIAFDEKGDRLTEEEVLNIRRNALGKMMSTAQATEMEALRGPDVDVDNPWRDWSQRQDWIAKQQDRS